MLFVCRPDGRAMFKHKLFFNKLIGEILVLNFLWEQKVERLDLQMMGDKLVLGPS